MELSGISLITSKTVKEMLGGISAPTFNKYKKQPGFPPPEKSFSSQTRLLWDRRKVEA